MARRAAIVLLVGVIATAHATAAHSASQHLDRAARGHHEAGEPRRAEGRHHHAAKRASSHTMTLDAVRRLIAEKRLEDALAACEKLPDRVRATPEARRIHADLLAWTGKLDRAAVEYDALLARSSTDANLRLARALVDKWRGQPLAAEQAMAAIQPASAETEEQLRILRASPEFQIARTRVAAAEHPDDPAAAIALARALMATDQLWEAEQTLARALAAHPTDSALLAAQAECRERKVTFLTGRITARQPGLANAPDGDPERVAQAEDLAALGRLEQAADEYERYTRAHPERRDLRRQAAQLLTWAGDYPRAERLYRGLLREQEDDAASRLELARVLAWDGDVDGARRTLDPMLVRADVGAGARALLGDLYRWDGAPAHAAALYRDALAGGLDGDAAAAARNFLADDARSTYVRPGFSYFYDSDHFRAFRTGVAIARRFDFATQGLVQYQHAAYNQHHHDLHADRGLFGVEHEWHPLRLGAQAGFTEYSSGVLRPLAAVQAELAPWPQHAIGLGYDRYDLIDDAATIRSAEPEPGDRGPRVIQGDRARGWLRAPLPSSFRLSLLGTLAHLDDGNLLDTAVLTLARRVLRHPRVDLAADVRTYGADDHSPRYWSPHRYWTTGVTVSIEQPVWRSVRVRLEGRGGYAEEDGSAAAEMSYGTRIDGDLGHGWSAALTYRGGEGAREGGYRSQAATAELTYRWPGGSL